MLAVSSEPRIRKSDRRGTTLQEMMVVLAILASLVGTGWPAIKGGLEKGQLRSATKQVRTELAATRLRAIETGVAHQFRYQLESGQFEIVPATASRDELAVSTDTDGLDSSEAEEILEIIEFELPEGISFQQPASSQADASDGEQDDADLEVIEEDGVGLDTESWSRPITFLPNGRTSNARITVWGEDGRHMVVSLRGLTGSATIGDMRRAENRETEIELDEVQE
jgi:type II secretory pathway pseudopilin PulG